MNSRKLFHPMVARDGIGFASVVAPHHKRYEGLYYWLGYWQQWDKVIKVEDHWWTVQEVDLEGNPVGEVRKHCTSMSALHFADKPFLVMSRYART